MIVVRKMNELVGVLCDWDHCSKVVSSYQGPHQAFRTVRRFLFHLPELA